MRMTLEWPEGPGKWRQTQVVVALSRRNNNFVKYQDQVYVFKKREEGEKVLSKIDGKWQVVGRITFGTIFIGGSEELSYGEWIRTPEGKAKLEANQELV
jgi:hypothetical protein